ncbi:MULTISPECIES: hypothetical protein [Halobacteriales]|uniref:hypothetical protein n=1 Tax=Halobacteriales TaxID=2235 RepID=UPI001091ABFD|nr:MULTISPECIES: hypothetical protein [Halobacteriales]
MGDDENDISEQDQNQQDEGEEEALGRSFIADTPDEDPRLEATGTNTSDGDGNEGEEATSESDE